jgi:threonine aldolase
MTAELQQFASDNYAGICPEAWAAMANANRGHVPAYGEDQWTQAAADAFRALFEKDDAEVFFAFNGTAANSLAVRNRGWRFYIFIGGGVRFMFAWDADPARVDALARDIRPISAATWRLAKAAASVYQDSQR